MPTYPSNVATVTVTGNWGADAIGTVTFTPNALLADGTSAPPQFVLPKPVTAVLVGGAISVTLMATDDSHLSPSGWVYTVVEQIVGQANRTYNILLPAAVSPVDLTAVARPVTPPALVTYVPLSTVAAKGDLIVATGLGAVARQAVGSDGQVLSADSAQVDGVRWVTLTAASVGAATTSRQILAGAGLTGGGDLSADRTLAVTYGTTAGTAAQGNDARITGALQSTNNLSDLTSAAAARSNLGAAAAVQLSVSNGSDDTAVINALLSANAGKRVRGLPGQTYLISAPLVIGSGTELDMTGCTVSLLAGSNCNLLNNAGVTGARDSAVTVTGGTWDRGSNAGSGSNLHCLRFRNVDGLTVRGVTVKSAAGKYAISIGNATNVKVTDVTFANTFSDGLHLIGPLSSVVVRDIFGTTGDDFVAITPQDWAAYDDTHGDVTDVVIENLYPVNSAVTAVKILGSPNGAARRIRVRNVFGSTTGTSGAVWIGDDAASPNTTGGVIDSVLVENVSTSVPNGSCLLNLNGTATKRVRFRGVHFDNSLSTAAIVQVNPATAATFASLIFEDITVPACGAQPIINVVANATITSLTIDRASIPAAVAWDLVYSKGTIADLIVRGVVANGTSYLLNLDQNTAGATVNRATFTDVHLAGSGGGGMVRAIASGQTLPNVAIAASMLNNMAWLADVNTVTEFDLSSVVIKSPGQGIANIRANAVITFAGDGNSLAPGTQVIKVAAGGKASVRIIDCPPTSTAGGLPTIAAGAGAGTSPTVTVAGTDRAGTVTVTPGTGPAAGLQATVTFVGTWPQTPKVALTPTNAAAQAAGAYVSSKSTTTFAISSANAPGGSMTFDYVIAA